MNNKVASSVWLGLQQVSLLAFALSVSVTMSASAQTGCSVRIVPSDADERWLSAAREARAQAEDLPATQQDCRQIVVRVEPGSGALVAITTLDGRTAVRQVAGPEELVPIVRALLVTLPAPIALKSPRPAEPPKPAPAANTAHTDDVLATGLAGAHAMVIAGGGGTLGIDRALGAPQARLALGALVGHFELGAFGARDFVFKRFGNPSPAGFSMNVTSVGLFGGVRQPVGRFGLIAGLELGAAFVREQVAGKPMRVDGTGTGQSQDMFVPGPAVKYRPTEIRTGAYLAAVVPLQFRFRLRLQLGGDAVPIRLGAAMPAGTTLLDPPRWAGTVMLGLEGTVM